MLPELWGAYHRNEEIRAGSSSGGVFTSLASVVLDRKGVVYGAAMTEDASGLHCRHIACENREDLCRLRGSKYTVSDVREAFFSARRELEQGRTVMFCGTPCQVAALYAFLGKQYDHLLTVDLICHGVPAPELLKKCLEEEARIHKKKVRHLEFRDKTEGWLCYSIKVIFEDGSTVRKTADRSRYMRMFLSDQYLRSSCYHCRFKGENHCSDITLGDFWDVQEYLEVSEETLRKGISAVVLRTEKGRSLFDAAASELTKQKSHMDYFIRSNRSYSESVLHPFDVALFRYLLSKWDTDRILSLYAGTDKIRKLAKRIGIKVRKILRYCVGWKKYEKSLPSHKDCCGCMNCVDVCPVKAIRIIRDDLGFEYPVVAPQSCISCGRCIEACPLCRKTK